MSWLGRTFRKTTGSKRLKSSFGNSGSLKSHVSQMDQLLGKESITENDVVYARLYRRKIHERRNFDSTAIKVIKRLSRGSLRLQEGKFITRDELDKKISDLSNSFE